jgi:protein ImuB
MDRRRLQAIALHCHAYSPLVGLEDSPTPESIWLDISGNEALFGGERGLSVMLRAEMTRLGFQVRVTIADSWGAAWAICHYGRADISLVPSGQQAMWLARLPIAALRIPSAAIQALQALDVSTIERLKHLPRASLPSRFGKELVRRLDQALGFAPELLTAERPVEPVSAEWLFEDPIADRQTIDHVCEVLLERLLTALDERKAGLRELACHWLGTTAEPTSLRLLRPTTDRRHLFDLLRLQCERRVFKTGIHGVRMYVVEMGLSTVRQTTLFGDDTHDRNPQSLAELVDRLSLRLGRHAVSRPRLIPDPQPEFACESSPWLDSQSSSETEYIPPLSQLRCRPLRLLRSPQPLLVQASSTTGLPQLVNQFRVIQIRGPERIETGWWRGPDIKRDYYRIDLANGDNLWVFADRGTGRWFLHGLFV